MLWFRKLTIPSFFDKRDESNFDYVTVHETAFDNVLNEDMESINHPDRLSAEATMINQNFSQQILRSSDKKDMEFPNPFVSTEEDAEPGAAVAYRYRKWDLGKGVNLYARCELNGVAMKRDEEELITAYALNEWDSKIAKGIEWRMKIDAQRGGILATELKNNSCKLAKWTSQAILAGADQMKLGYVSRVNRRDPHSHVVLGTHSYKPREFASQIALNVNNMWGIIKMLVDLFLRQDNGKYVIMKDANKPVVRIYAVPATTFDEEDDEEEEDN